MGQLFGSFLWVCDPISFEMQLLSVSFIVFLVKISVSVIPGIIGLYLLFTSKERKRDLRNKFCGRVFGVSNAIPSKKFARTLTIIGVLLLILSVLLTYLLIIIPMMAN